MARHLTQLPKNYIPLPSDLLQRSMVDRFEQVVTAYPERTAVSVGGVSMNYRALNDAANRLAHVLLSSKETGPIPFMIGHDPGAVITIIGILKTGRPYVALDPNNPQDHNRFILADLGVHLLLDRPRSPFRGREDHRRLTRCELIGPG